MSSKAVSRLISLLNRYNGGAELLSISHANLNESEIHELLDWAKMTERWVNSLEYYPYWPREGFVFSDARIEEKVEDFRYPIRMEITHIEELPKSCMEILASDENIFVVNELLSRNDLSNEIYTNVILNLLLRGTETSFDILKKILLQDSFTNLNIFEELKEFRDLSVYQKLVSSYAICKKFNFEFDSSNCDSEQLLEEKILYAKIGNLSNDEIKRLYLDCLKSQNKYELLTKFFDEVENIPKKIYDDFAKYSTDPLSKDDKVANILCEHPFGTLNKMKPFIDVPIHFSDSARREDRLRENTSINNVQRKAAASKNITSETVKYMIEFLKYPQYPPVLNVIIGLSKNPALLKMDNEVFDWIADFFINNIKKEEKPNMWCGSTFQLCLDMAQRSDLPVSFLEKLSTIPNIYILDCLIQNPKCNKTIASNVIDFAKSKYKMNLFNRAVDKYETM